MVIYATGNVVMKPIICGKCKSTLRRGKHSIKCYGCGAVYRMDSEELDGDEVTRIYEFVEFQCIWGAYTKTCENKCPAPEMCCEEHIKDEYFTFVQNSMSAGKIGLERDKHMLERMEESKKTWLIQKVSGLYEQKDSIWKDQDGED